MPSAWFQGRRRMLVVGCLRGTDDNGRVPVIGLSPGTYYLQAMLRETWTVTENGVSVNDGPRTSHRHPCGVPHPRHARRATVACLGQSAANNT